MRLDSNLTINERIKVCRRLCGFSQSKMAELMEMKTSTYSQMERRGRINSEKIKKLSKIFGIETDELLYGIAEEKKAPKTEEKTDSKEIKPISEIVFDQREAVFLSPIEENIIKIIRNSSKSKREEIIEFIEKTAGLGKWKK